LKSFLSSQNGHDRRASFFTQRILDKRSECFSCRAFCRGNINITMQLQAFENSLKSGSRDSRHALDAFRWIQNRGNTVSNEGLKDISVIMASVLSILKGPFNEFIACLMP
jgi:hypothetical protein